MNGCKIIIVNQFNQNNVYNHFQGLYMKSNILHHSARAKLPYPGRNYMRGLDMHASVLWSWAFVLGENNVDLRVSCVK